MNGGDTTRWVLTWLTVPLLEPPLQQLAATPTVPAIVAPKKTSAPTWYVPGGKVPDTDTEAELLVPVTAVLK